MIHECIFCGSPSAAWPAEASDYVKGYRLCEYHMGGVLSSATKREYDKDKVLYAETFHDAIRKIWCNAHDFLREQASVIDPGFSAELDEANDMHPALYEAYKSIDAWYDSVEQKDIGKPINEWIDDSAVDDWVVKKIKYAAVHGRVHRCAAEKQNSPDGRCVAYSKTDGGLCNQCAKNRSKVKFAYKLGETAKINAALAALRGD